MADTTTIAPADSAALEPNRLPEMFARVAAEGRTAIMPFATAGYPTMEISEQIILALVEAGADGIEIGIPFSDPIADGTAVQRTSQVSLEQGTRLKDVIALVRRLRAQGVTVPLMLMGYLNPALKYGIERYVADATAAGADGFIVPDLPAEESDAFHAACVANGRPSATSTRPTIPIRIWRPRCCPVSARAIRSRSRRGWSRRRRIRRRPIGIA